MLSYGVFSVFICLGFSQANALSHAFKAQAIHSIYVTHQAISAELIVYGKGHSGLAEFEQSLENYQAMSLNLARTLEDELRNGYAASDSLFLIATVKTQRNLAQMAASYRSFLQSKDPLLALEYNKLHNEVWSTIQELMYLEDK